MSNYSNAKSLKNWSPLLIIFIILISACSKSRKIEPGKFELEKEFINRCIVEYGDDLLMKEILFCSSKSPKTFKEIEVYDVSYSVNPVSYSYYKGFFDEKGVVQEIWMGENSDEGVDVQCRLTSTLQLKTGETVQIRKTSSPDANQALIYQALGIDSYPGNTEKSYF